MNVWIVIWALFGSTILAATITFGELTSYLILVVMYMTSCNAVSS